MPAQSAMAERYTQAADALSHHPHCPPSVRDDLLEYDTDGDLTLSQAPSITQIRASVSDPTETESLHLHQVRRHAAEDQEYQVLKETILSSYPNKKPV